MLDGDRGRLPLLASKPSGCSSTSTFLCTAERREPWPSATACRSSRWPHRRQVVGRRARCGRSATMRRNGLRGQLSGSGRVATQRSTSSWRTIQWSGFRSEPWSGGPASQHRAHRGYSTTVGVRSGTERDVGRSALAPGVARSTIRAGLMTSPGSTTTADDTSIKERQRPGRLDVLPEEPPVQREPGKHVDPPDPQLRNTPEVRTARGGCAEPVTRPRYSPVYRR